MDLPTTAPTAPEMTFPKRVRAFLDMWLVDHGFIRSVYLNLHQISPQAFRSAQPSPGHLRALKARGIKTILNLRGQRDTCGSYQLEAEACRKLGLILIDFPIRSRSPLDRPTLVAAAHLFDRIEYPMVMHCKSGADRAGFMSTLYVFLHEDVPLREAMKKHLSFAYGHVRQAKTGIIDFFFEKFLAETQGRPEDFVPWVETAYDRDRLEAEFRENWLAGLIVNKILMRE